MTFDGANSPTHIRSLNMKALVMGCGRVGAMIATALWEEGHQVVVLDANPESLRLLPEELQQEAIVGDGTLEEDLIRGGIENRDVFVAVSPEDNRQHPGCADGPAHIPGKQGGLPYRRYGAI